MGGVNLSFTQESRHTGEFIVTLINTGTSWDVTIKMTAMGARWDENYELTDDYETATVNLESLDGTVAYFDHVSTSGAGIANPVYAIGLYKISAIEDGEEQAYFYFDLRTSDWSGSVDTYFKYDVLNKRFRNSANTTTIDYTVQTLWDLTVNDLETSGLEDYWTNCLNMIDNGNNNPKIVWGPHPTFKANNYKIYRAIYSTPLSNPEASASLKTTVNSSTYSYVDTDVTLNSGGYYVYYFVKAYNGNYSGRTNITNTRAYFYKDGIYTEEKLENNLELSQNYPNPFNPSTVIKYYLPNSSFVNLSIFNSLGEKVSTLLNEIQNEGDYSIEFDASFLPSGVYFYRLEAGQFRDTKKMILMR